MKAELVFIPSPGASHLASTVEMAKLLVHRDARLSITVLIMKPPYDPKASTLTQSLVASSIIDRIRFVDLPHDEPDPDNNLKGFMTSFFESQKPHVKEFVTNLISTDLSVDSPRLAGFVLDMFCTTMIDVANEFGVPSYMFFTSGAAFLGLEFYVQALHDDQNKDITEFKDSDAELPLPILKNPLPAKVLPSVMLNKEWVNFIYDHARRYRQMKGIMVNTFTELESSAVSSLSEGMNPPVYPVGPLLNLTSIGHDLEKGGYSETSDIIMNWLDDQPPLSVVFLCFGSRGSFHEDQVKEIACALEQSGHRFLWSLRQPPPKDKFARPSAYTNLEDVLPQGFLDRTSGIGKVIGWAPQVAILAHWAIGGFVSHCGWNSTLESLWFGVPIATWPLYAEQQFNAFEMVIELGLAVEIKMDYRNDFFFPDLEIVRAEEIEKGIRCLMDHENEIRTKVKQMSEKSRKALMEGGSSHTVLGRYIQDVMDNMP